MPYDQQKPAHATAANKESWLQHFPAPMFAIGMGTAGLGIAWRKAGQTLGVSPLMGEYIIGFAAALIALITLTYLAKALLHRHNVAQEFNHPVRVNFFPGFSICLLLLSVGALPHSKQLAFGLWSAGAIIHFSFTLTLIRRWITRNFEINHSNPAWFIPVVGNVIVPITGVKLGYMELSWMFFSIGILFWLILFTIVFNRIIFHDQLPAKFIPTLFILIAPPSIGFISYVGLNAGIIDGFARILFYSAFFIGLLMATMWKQFLSVPFYISWWAYTFPLDALSIATLEMGHISHNPAISYIAPVILGITTVVVALVLIRTGIAIAKKTLFVPE